MQRNTRSLTFSLKSSSFREIKLHGMVRIGELDVAACCKNALSLQRKSTDDGGRGREEERKKKKSQLSDLTLWKEWKNLEKDKQTHRAIKLDWFCMVRMDGVHDPSMYSFLYHSFSLLKPLSLSLCLSNEEDEGIRKKWERETKPIAFYKQKEQVWSFGSQAIIPNRWLA